MAIFASPAPVSAVSTPCQIQIVASGQGVDVTAPKNCWQANAQQALLAFDWLSQSEINIGPFDWVSDGNELHARVTTGIVPVAAVFLVATVNEAEEPLLNAYGSVGFPAVPADKIQVHRLGIFRNPTNDHQFTITAPSTMMVDDSMRREAAAGLVQKWQIIPGPFDWVETIIPTIYAAG